MRPVLLLVFLLLAHSLYALEIPPAPVRWVTDSANILSTTDEAFLDTKLKNFEQESGAQFIVYTLPSIENEAIEDFTIRAVEKWKVGQKKYDNGLVLFVFVNDRKVRIETGYGLEGSITDAVASRVIREQMAPHFQKNDYNAGLNAAADEIMRRIRTGEKPVEPLQPTGGQPSGEPGGFDIGTIVFIAIILFFFVLPMLQRRRGGGCGGCIPMVLPMGGGGGVTFGGGGFSGGGFGGGFGGGGGGFSGGGGGFGGGGATGGW